MMLSCQPWYDYNLKRFCVIETRTVGEREIITDGCPLRQIDEPVRLLICMGPENVLGEENSSDEDAPDEGDASDEGDAPDEDDAPDEPDLEEYRYWDENSRGCRDQDNILHHITYDQLMAYYSHCRSLSFHTLNHYYEVDICTLTNQAHIESLCIGGCRLANLHGIEYFSSLRELTLHYCCTPEPLSDLFLLSGLPIEELWILGTPVAPGSFLDLPRLRKITVSDTNDDRPANHFECLAAANTRLPMLEKIAVRIGSENDWDDEEYMTRLKKSLEKQHPGISIEYRYD